MFNCTVHVLYTYNVYTMWRLHARAKLWFIADKKKCAVELLQETHIYSRANKSGKFWKISSFVIFYSKIYLVQYTCKVQPLVLYSL